MLGISGLESTEEAGLVHGSGFAPVPGSHGHKTTGIPWAMDSMAPVVAVGSRWEAEGLRTLDSGAERRLCGRTEVSVVDQSSRPCL